MGEPRRRHSSPQAADRRRTKTIFTEDNEGNEGFYLSQSPRSKAVVRSSPNLSKEGSLKKFYRRQRRGLPTQHALRPKNLNPSLPSVKISPASMRENVA